MNGKKQSVLLKFGTAALLAIFLSCAVVSGLQTGILSPTHVLGTPSNASGTGSSDQSGDEWPMFGAGLTHSGMTSTTMTSNPGPYWNTTLSSGTGSGIASSPAVTNGRVYIGTLDGMYCLNANTGAILWHNLTGTMIEYSSPAVAGDYVYVGSNLDQGWFFCLNATTGFQIWNYSTSDNIDSAPAVTGGFVYIAGTTQIGSPGYTTLLRLNATDSTLQDERDNLGTLTSFALASGHLIIGTDVPTAGSGTYGYSSFPATNFATPTWQYNAGISYYTYSSPCVNVSSTSVFANAYYAGNLTCLDLNTGSVKWSTHVNPDSSPCLGEQGTCVYIACSDGTVKCLNVTNGNVLWTQTAFSLPNADWSNPADAATSSGGFLYLSSRNGNFYCLNDMTGAIVWKYAIAPSGGALTLSSPAICNGRVYVGSADNNVYCFPMNVPVIPPAATTLYITPSTSTNGTFALEWLPSAGAAQYNLYRYTGAITSLNGSVTKVNTLSSTYTWDTVLANGTYYYVVTAVNASGESGISNCVSGTVAIPAPTNAIPQIVPANTPVTLPCTSGGNDLADLTLNTTRPVSVALNFTTTNPVSTSLTTAVGYLQINCNDTAAVNFPITLKVYYDASAVAAQGLNASNLGVWYYNSASTWEFIGGSVNTADHSVTVTLTHLSTFAIANNSVSSSGTNTAPAGVPGYPLWAIGIAMGAITCVVIWKKKSRDNL